MKKPINQNQEVLLHLINEGCASCLDFAYMSGFRTRISNLKNDYGVPLKRKLLKFTNKYGNASMVAWHYLEDKSKAIEIYNKLCSTNG